MNRALMGFIIPLALAAAAAGCSGKQGSSGGAGTSASVSAIVVAQGDLMDALWGTAKEPDPNAACLAASSFPVDSAGSFMIQKREGLPTEYNMAPVVIVSPINIIMPDPATDGRGEGCGDSEIRYIVTASGEYPIDIEAADEIASMQPLESMAGDLPTPYPANCTIKAHFEKQAAGACVSSPEQPEPDEENQGGSGEPSAPEGGAAMSAEGEPQGDDEVGGKENQQGETGNCSVGSLKLVVDEYNCVVNNFVK